MDLTRMHSTNMIRHEKRMQRFTPDPNFLKFIDKVEKIVYARLQMYLDDLPDEDYYMAFENETTPEQMAKLVIESNLTF